MKILIAEDEGIIAVSIYEILKQLQYNPYQPAASTDEALRILNTQQVDLAFVDIYLGEYYSGFMLAQKLNELKIPYFFLTALYDKDTINVAKQYQPNAYLVKPFTKANIFATIEMIAAMLPVKESTDGVVLELKINENFVQLSSSQILICKAKDKYINFIMDDGKTYMARITLQEVIEHFAQTDIVQVHKSFLVNLNKIDALKWDEIKIGKYAIPIGRTYKDELKNRAQKKATLS